MKCKVYQLFQTLPSGTKNFLKHYDVNNNNAFWFTTKLSDVYTTGDFVKLKSIEDVLKTHNYKFPFILKETEFNLEES